MINIAQSWEFGERRLLRTISNSSLRCSGVSLLQRILARPEPKMFLITGGLGVRGARAAARMISLRCSGVTLAHRFSAPLRPPSLWASLTGFFDGNSPV